MEHLTRRHVLIGSGLALGVLARGQLVSAQAAPATAGPADPKLVEDLVAANRILVDQGVVDGYGHVSVRHDKAADRYLMSRSIAPELVTAADIMEYDLDSVPVDPQGRAIYLERFIHGEIYRIRPDVRAIVHNHSPSVIPFGVTGAQLRPLYHMSAFLWPGVPVFSDIRQARGGPGDRTCWSATPRSARPSRARSARGPSPSCAATARSSSPATCPRRSSEASTPRSTRGSRRRRWRWAAPSPTSTPRRPRRRRPPSPGRSPGRGSSGSAAGSK